MTNKALVERQTFHQADLEVTHWEIARRPVNQGESLSRYVIDPAQPSTCDGPCVASPAIGTCSPSANGVWIQLSTCDGPCVASPAIGTCSPSANGVWIQLSTCDGPCVASPAIGTCSPSANGVWIQLSTCDGPCVASPAIGTCSPSANGVWIQLSTCDGPCVASPAISVTMQNVQSANGGLHLTRSGQERQRAWRPSSDKVWTGEAESMAAFI
ncbi:hypothetical protein ACOMHN_056063 [Nucella lapillus]